MYVYDLVLVGRKWKVLKNKSKIFGEIGGNVL